MDGIRLCMIALVGVSAAMILREWKSDLLPLLRIGVTLLFGFSLIRAVTPLVTFLSEMTEATGVPDSIPILFKGLGIAVLTQICADIARDCGENSIASGVELTGKVEILLLCLPLITEILSSAREWFSLGEMP